MIFKFDNKTSGQGFIELMLLSLILISSIKYILIFFWICISVLWMEHHLYQGLICAAQQKPIEICKALVKQKIKILQPLGAIMSLNITNIQHRWKGGLQWSFYKKRFFITQSLALPQ